MHNTIIDKETSTTTISINIPATTIPTIATMNKSFILLVYDEEILTWSCEYWRSWWCPKCDCR